ncbi:hypothetical protein L1F30_12275 [Simiduia sp. 21SJ11W-1]|uniref:hypothetical protein n=1 Tax=Simiduia sp. 21SJ11W-1 TaxID=2909669 RepID=UPI0020A22DDE|nr:hypothetical protein [Simiduia sp. 21SJ11W-1]UTA46937.1 hypothetical protein L1F30_12275 [Simiduia sp. 21SJ11W-1]
MSAPTLASSEVNCRIDSDSFLEPGYQEIQSESVILSDAPGTPNGRRKIYSAANIDIFVSTSGYTRTSEGITLGTYDIQLVDRLKKQSIATTSASDGHKMAVLTLTEMDDKRSPTNRLIVTCFGATRLQ